MKNSIKSLFAILLAFTLLISTTVVIFAGDNIDPLSKPSKLAGASSDKVINEGI